MNARLVSGLADANLWLTLGSALGQVALMLLFVLGRGSASVERAYELVVLPLVALTLGAALHRASR